MRSREEEERREKKYIILRVKLFEALEQKLSMLEEEKTMFLELLKVNIYRSNNIYVFFIFLLNSSLC